MKARFCKTIVLITVVALLLSMLSGCAVSSKKDNESNADATTGVPETSAPPVKLKMMLPETWAGTEFGYATGLPLVKEIEKRTNVILDFEVYSQAEFGQVMTARLAGGVDLPDIFYHYADDASMFKFGHEGLFLELNDLIDKYAPNIKQHYNVDFPTASKYLADENGKIYWLRRLHFSEGWNYESIIFREDWMKKAGIAKAPETTDEFYEYLKQVQEIDANGNGLKDEVFTTNALDYIHYALMPAFGISGTWWVANGWSIKDSGEVYFPWVTPEMKDYVAYFNKLYKEGLIEKEIYETDNTKYEAKVAANTVSATVHFPYNATKYYPDLVKNVDGVKWTPLKPLKGSRGAQYYYEIAPALEGGKFFITRDCKNPEAAIKFWDFAMSEEGRLLTNFGLEGIHWERNPQGVPVKTQKWKDEIKKDPNAAYKWGSIYFMPTWTYAKFDEVAINWDPERQDVIDIVRESLKLPKFQTLVLSAATPQEQEQMNLYEAEVRGYAWTMINAFIKGEEPLSKWDDYVNRVNELGLDKVKVIIKAQYDRLNK